MTTANPALSAVANALAAGDIQIVDLTASLGPDTPVIQLPPQFSETPSFKMNRLSNYDGDGPLWAWGWMELGEHTGTHFDAPVHWVTGKDLPDNTTDKVSPQSFVAPCVVIDCHEQAAADADFLLTADMVKDWEARHGEIKPGTWVLMRSDWSLRNGSSETFLNIDENGSHVPGPSVDCVEYLVSKKILGWGSEGVGTDAGSAGGMNPPFPAHALILGAGGYGLASLINLDKLPPTGALLVVAPLKIIGGTGSPVRAFALVPRG